MKREVITMYCKNCGKEMPDGAKFCRTCGEKNSDGPSNEHTSKERERQQTNSVAKGILLVIVLIIAVWMTISGTIGLLGHP